MQKIVALRRGSRSKCRFFQICKTIFSKPKAYGVQCTYTPQIKKEWVKQRGVFFWLNGRRSCSNLKMLWSVREMSPMYLYIPTTHKSQPSSLRPKIAHPPFDTPQFDVCSLSDSAPIRVDIIGSTLTTSPPHLVAPPRFRSLEKSLRAPLVVIATRFVRRGGSGLDAASDLPLAKCIARYSVVVYYYAPLIFFQTARSKVAHAQLQYCTTRGSNFVLLLSVAHVIIYSSSF